MLFTFTLIVDYMCDFFTIFNALMSKILLHIIMFSTIIITIGSQHTRLHSSNQLLDEEG